MATTNGSDQRILPTWVIPPSTLTNLMKRLPLETQLTLYTVPPVADALDFSAAW